MFTIYKYDEFIKNQVGGSNFELNDSHTYSTTLVVKFHRRGDGSLDQEMIGRSLEFLRSIYNRGRFTNVVHNDSSPNLIFVNNIDRFYPNMDNARRIIQAGLTGIFDQIVRERQERER